MLAQIFSLLVFLCHATRISAQEQRDGETELMAIMKQPLLIEPDLFGHATRIISSLESAPSCHRLAARNLLESCQSLQDPKQAESNLALDQIKSVFAARLAVCELNGAHATIPPQCSSMVPKPIVQGHGFKCLLPGKKCSTTQTSKEKARTAFQGLSSQQLGLCLNALESRPQWWTSYSNARQNAVVICHAARSQVDKEEIINTHQAMMEATKEISQSLLSATELAQQTRKAQEAYNRKIETFQLRILNELESRGTSLFNTFRQAEDDFGGLIGRFYKYFNEATDSLRGFNTEVKQAVRDTEKLKSIIDDSSSDVMSKNRALGQAIDLNQHKTDESTLALRSSMEEIRAKDLVLIQRSLQNVQITIEAQTHIMQLLLNAQSSMAEKMNHLNDTLRHVEDQASIANKSLEIHAEALAHLMHNLTSTMEATNDLAVLMQTNINDARISLAASFLRVFQFFNLSSILWPALALFIAAFSYLTLGGRVARCVLGIELLAYIVQIAWDHLNALGGLQNHSSLGRWQVLSGISMAVVFAAVTFYVLWDRRRTRQHSFEGDTIVFNPKSLHKRRYPSYISSYASSLD